MEVREVEKSDGGGKRLCSCVITAASEDAGDSTGVECKW